MKEHVPVVHRARIDARDAQFELRREDAAHKREPVAHFVAVLLRSIAAHDAACAIFHPRLELHIITANLGEQLSQLRRLDRKRPKPDRPVHLLLPAEPHKRRDHLDARHAFDDRALPLRQQARQRDFIAHGHTQRRVRVRRRLREFAQHDHERDEEKQAHRRAQHAEQQPALVAQRIADDEAGDAHGREWQPAAARAKADVQKMTGTAL